MGSAGGGISGRRNSRRFWNGQYPVNPVGGFVTFHRGAGGGGLLKLSGWGLLLIRGPPGGPRRGSSSGSGGGGGRVPQGLAFGVLIQGGGGGRVRKKTGQ